MSKEKNNAPNAEKQPGKVKALFGKVKSMWSKAPEGRYLTLKESGCFGVYTLGVAFIYTAIQYVATAVFIPYFYGIKAIHGYIILALASLFNLLVLPPLANKMQKTNTKWGRYKPYILFSLPLYALLAFLFLWIPQLETETARVTYAYITCVPMLLVNGFFYNMYQTMPTIITPNTQERADLMTPVGLIFGFAPSLLQIIAGPIRSHFMKQGREYMAMRLIGIISIVIGILCILFIMKVQERVYRIEKEENPEEKIGLGEAFKMLAKNKPLIILTIALVLGSLREFTGQFRMLILQCRLSENAGLAMTATGIPMTIIGFAYTVAMLLLPLVTRKLDKKWIMVIFGITMGLPNLILGIVGYENIPVGGTSAVVLTILHFLMQVSPIYLLVPIMLGEVADYQQAKTGKRLDGHIQNLLFTLPLLASQIFMIISYFWQVQVDFEPSYIKDFLEEAGAAAAEAQKAGLEAPIIALPAELQAKACSWYNIVSYISAGSSFLMVFVMLFYPLSRKKHEEIVAELKVLSGDNLEEAHEVKETDDTDNENVVLDVENQDGTVEVDVEDAPVDEVAPVEEVVSEEPPLEEDPPVVEEAPAEEPAPVVEEAAVEANEEEKPQEEK